MQSFEAAHKEARQLPPSVSGFDFRGAFKELTEHDLGLQPGKCGSDAEVHTLKEMLRRFVTPASTNSHNLRVLAKPQDELSFDERLLDAFGRGGWVERGRVNHVVLVRPEVGELAVHGLNRLGGGESTIPAVNGAGMARWRVVDSSGRSTR